MFRSLTKIIVLVYLRKQNFQAQQIKGLNLLFNHFVRERWHFGGHWRISWHLLVPGYFRIFINLGKIRIEANNA